MRCFICVICVITNPLSIFLLNCESPSQSYESKYEKKEGEFKYNDGEDPEEVDAGSTESITLDIVDALSKFPKLHALDISSRTPLNAR